MDSLTPDEIAEARRICGIATSGPWSSHITPNIQGGQTCLVDSEVARAEVCFPDRWEDAQFIAAARSLLPRLLDEREALLARAEQMREVLEHAIYANELGVCSECHDWRDKKHGGPGQPHKPGCAAAQAIASGAGKGWLSPEDVDALLADLRERCALRVESSPTNDPAWASCRGDAGRMIRAMPLRREEKPDAR